MKKITHLIFIIFTITLLACTDTEQPASTVRNVCVKDCGTYGCDSGETKRCPVSDPGKICSENTTEKTLQTCTR